MRINPSSMLTPRPPPPAFPSEKEVQTARAAITAMLDKGDWFGGPDVDRARLPKSLQAVLARVERATPDGVAMTAATIGGKSYYVLQVDENSGNGYVRLYDKAGREVTGAGFEYGESGDTEFFSSPAERRVEARIERTLERTFTAKALGGPGAAKHQVPESSLPAPVREAFGRQFPKNDYFHYRLEIDGKTYYVQYCSLSADNPNLARHTGSVTVVDETGRCICRSWVEPGKNQVQFKPDVA